MKICIIGNSHLGAIKNGLGRMAKDTFAHDVTFFGAPSTTLKHLRAEGDCLFTSNPVLLEHLKKTNDGVAEVSLTPFDLVVVLGGQLHLTTALHLFKDHRPAAFLSDEVELISEPAFGAALDDAYERSTAVHVLKLLLPSGKPLLIVPAPLRSELILGQNEYPYLADPALAARTVAWLVAACRSSWERIAHRFGAKLLHQPPATIGGTGLTKAEFAGARVFRDGRWFDEPDTVHTNGKYGEQVLACLNSHLNRAAMPTEAH